MGGCENKTVDWELASLLIGFCIFSALFTLVVSVFLPPLFRKWGWNEMARMVENPDYRPEMPRRRRPFFQEEPPCTNEGEASKKKAD
eukprot:CAMPEP_0196735644 /NCGR_PEP_ID=MMETSP1091-20130531/14006_1 /TAXON_ID=302021 /ORGANISM="Rhodomonas sp., Strain CCMP768" /LENGTH=86 /DNA_ID=CAMNT_0042079299 /DNA_START=8 /DNA_END=268 /DNA_ORIENTATION=-